MSEDLVDRQTDQKIRPLLALRKIAAASHQSGELRELTDRNGVRTPRASSGTQKQPYGPRSSRKLLILKVN